MSNEMQNCSFPVTVRRATTSQAIIAKLRVLLILIAIVISSVIAFSQSGVVMHKNDLGRSGAYLNETVLNTTNVKAATFGKLFTRAVDGQLYAQPLYLPAVNFGPQGVHNVVYVATMKNNVYAYDADDPTASTPLWQVNLGVPPTTADVGDREDISDTVGITGTPVIDTVSGTLYCVAKTKEGPTGSTFVQRLHALDILTGAEKFGGPVVISGSVPGTGDDSVNGTVSFNPWRNLNRPGLLLLNGVVYIAFGSHGDNRPYHGWVFGYDATTLQRTAIYNTTPNGWGGAVWASGQGLTSDDAGNIYIETGNGSFDMTTGGTSCSSCFVKLATPSLTVVDWFAPWNQATYNANDYELGVTGPMLLPGTNLIEGGAKDGIHYILDRNNLGHFNAGNNSQIFQSLQVTWGNHLHAAPVYWISPVSGTLVYSWHEDDYLKTFNLVNGRYPGTLDSSGLALPFASSTMAAPTGMPGGVLTVSANGSVAGTGIVWATVPVSLDANHQTVAGILRAFDAQNVAVELWNSLQNAARDDFGNLAKYAPVIVANGKVYVGTFSNQLVVYGLLSNGPAPTVTSIAPGKGSTSGGTSITITGSGFAAGATVSVGGVSATGIALSGSTTIMATTPAHAAGTVGVTVMNPDGQTGTLNSAFTYVPPPPVVNTVAPSTGSTNGATVITITGTGFVQGATVTLDGTAATGVTVTGGTIITATTPPHAGGTVDVTVINPDTQSGVLPAAFTYIVPGPAPTVTSVTPANGPTTGGTVITVAGTNFVSGSRVTIGGVPATATTVGDSMTIVATTPAHAAGAADVTITNPDDQQGTLTGGFTYVVVTPTIASVTPASGSTSGGTAITITGTNYATGATVSVGGTAATGVAVVSSTTITATTPAHAAGAVSITVTNPNGQSGTKASAFAYLGPAPTISSVSPTSGSTNGGTSLTIRGTNFVAGATVGIGGTMATAVTVSSNTRITATTPAHAAGLANLTVTNPDTQTATATGAFTFVAPAPTVTSVAPVSGSTVGGTAVTITGTNFQTGATVTVGGNAATNLTVVSSTSITATTPAHAAGAVSVVVKNPDGQTGTRPNAFTYVAPPTVTSLTPTTGSTNGGTSVTITGTGFVAGATVSFGGTPATAATVNSSTKITTTTPAHVFGAVDVTVTNPDTQTATRQGAFTFAAPAPTVTGVAPATGSTSGGTAITITGTNFLTGATVTVGGTAATNISVVGATSITATTSAHAAGAVTVVVTNPDSQGATRTNAFTYASPPNLATVAPANGSTAGGTGITITGTGFTAGATVTVGGTAATGVTVSGTTTITATTPAHVAGVVDVVVTNPDTQSGTLANAFTYGVPPPVITTVAPGVGPIAGGTLITITGTSFVAGATVTVGGVPATVGGVTSTSITATTAAHAAGAVDVVVTNPDTQSGTRTNAFTYAGPPTVTAVTPSSGSTAGGTGITISGAGFITGATVSVGGAAATGVTVSGGTTITATAPAHTAGVVNVVVTNPDTQSGTLANSFTYTVPAPAITTVAPGVGPIAGGTLITITGNNFVAGATVTVGGVSATVGAVTSTSITATTPAHAAGTVDVVVTNPDTQSVTRTNAFTYAGPPTVTTVTPPSGSTAGGTGITITGTGFTAGATVTVGGAAATGVTVSGTTTITATTLAHAAGLVDVAVTNPDTQSGTLTNAFTYVVPPPTITSMTPTSGPIAGGTLITITGTSFVAGATVTVGGVSATVGAVTSTSITATTPAHAAGAVDVVVTNPDTQSGTRTNAFTYAGPPTVTSVTPPSGSTAGGTGITISGTGFITGATVSVGGTAATSVTVSGGTTITATAPAHAAGVVNVVVTNPDTQSGTLANSFTYTVPPPAITTVAPGVGPIAGGTLITITGNNFVAGATVTVGGVSATVGGVTSTSITATTAAHAAGAVDVVVTNPDTQSGTRTNAFTYAGPPTVTAVTPPSGSTAGGTGITISGAGFITGATVSVGGTAATGVTVSGGTTITATAPAHAAGVVNVVVTNPDTQSATLTNAFTYVVPPPTITSMTPTSGPIAGGSLITIAGNNFVAGATVTVGGITATIGVVTSTSITATTPAHAAGAVSVVVTNPDAQSATLANGFTYSSGATPISLVQHISKDAGTTVSSTLAFAAANTAQNLIVVVVRAEHAGQTFTISDTRGNTYRNAAVVNDTVDGTSVGIFYAENIAAGANTVTVADKQSGTLRFAMMEYTGVATANSLDVAIGATGSSTTPSSGSITTAVDGELVIAGISIAEAVTTTPGAGFVIEELVPATSVKLVVEDRRQTSAGQATGNATLSTSKVWVAIVATFKPGP
jgi:hypothetical protein